MRRAERACDSPEFLNAIFDEVEVMTVAFHCGEHPYPVPLNFVHIDGSLYFHCALEGRKLDCITHDSRVGFSIFRFLGIDRAKATTCYQSVCGTGTAEFVTDPALKQAALAALAAKYESKCTLPVPDTMLAATAVVRIVITSMTGKRNDRSDLKS